MRNHAEISDIELLELLRGGDDKHAFNEIYARYWEKMYGAAYKRLRSTEVAEEIVQDLFTDIWLRRDSLHITTSLPVYLFSAVRYRVINYIHHELVKNNYQQTILHSTRDFDNSTEELVLLSDLNKRIKTQVNLLPEKCRAIFELSRDEHKSNKEIARSLGISEKTVENHITKALRRLRTSLGSFF
ncbi:RNA polymerase sigma-70 factor [Mucilaginibacter hurinus]|uniref:RNA polymerase sigma-70 factor n=1 Tax=Mucilaginibacter hurinus TaxID=2201324 RepID=A0A367GTF8_9SPHI|nr:RNA polymerase sigma-70 factor [Mucilaginibacter hurinus]RCH56116.1 RNA polymerase sigma-70 factor [Mucilaginibacter hurinus]